MITTRQFGWAQNLAYFFLIYIVLYLWYTAAMLAKVFSGTVVGVDGVLVEVEVDIIKKGFPGFAIVGLPGKAVEEAKERVRSALLNLSVDFPQYRITVNLAPADLPKPGPTFDLPMAVGILLASQQLPTHEILEGSFFLGELSLKGELRHTNSVLPLTILAKEKGFRRIFLPEANALEASIVEGIEIVPLRSLEQVISAVHGLGVLPTLTERLTWDSILVDHSAADFSEIYGQEQAKRALEIAAAGGHNVLMYGPPGTGKTLLARALPSILPPLHKTESLEVSKLYSIVGSIDPQQPVLKKRPFRAPHHTTSRVGLIGGGSSLLPGEISLAHRGVLFLDEFPEFPRSVVESLRQPLEDGWVHISRAAGSAKFPSRFMLIAAANPCPCGFWGTHKECICTVSQKSRYAKRLSGPIMDRIDIHLEVAALEVEKLMKGFSGSDGEKSETIRQRVMSAREIQYARLIDETIFTNAEMNAQRIKTFCALDTEGEKLLHKAIGQYEMSVRSVHKVLKLARTIADLDRQNTIRSSHLAEALQFRPVHLYGDIH